MDQRLPRYVWVLLAVALVLFGIQQGWKQALKLGCLPYDGVKPAEGWLGSCASDRIGEIDESVIWFGTEKAVGGAILAADVIIFGDSRIEVALSRGDATDWFASRHLRSYLLAFGGAEESGWAQKLLARFHPQPRVVIFNVDPYFTGGLSQPARSITADPAGELNAVLEAQSFIRHGMTYCKYLPWLCGRTSTSYRAYIDGHIFSYQPERFWFGKAETGRYPIHQPPPWDTSFFESYLQNARTVIAAAGTDPKCVVFTVVPNNDVDDALARFLAERIGASAVSPNIDTPLFTSDTSHLTVESSKIWTARFLAQLEPIVLRCKASASPTKFPPIGESQ